MLSTFLCSRFLGALRSKFRQINFGRNEIRTQGYWVRSTNATFMLRRPQPDLMIKFRRSGAQERLDDLDFHWKLSQSVTGGDQYWKQLSREFRFSSFAAEKGSLKFETLREENNNNNNINNRSNKINNSSSSSSSDEPLHHPENKNVAQTFLVGCEICMIQFTTLQFCSLALE